MEQTFEMIAKTFQGLEEVLAAELTTLGADNIQTGRRMVAFTGDKEMLYRANFCLRTALRILRPIKHFTAADADAVYEAVKEIRWEDYLDPAKTFAVDATVFSEDFRHSKFVSYRVKDAIADYFREKTGKRPSVSITKPDVLLNIHIAQTDCTLSLDSSGESLHRRGYRQEAVEAPLNEVLAAGMILLTGWKGECDLIDPMCGSGTIPIEAALIARNIAPGLFRRGYAFEHWPDFDATCWSASTTTTARSATSNTRYTVMTIPSRPMHCPAQRESGGSGARYRAEGTALPAIRAAAGQGHHHHQPALWRAHLLHRPAGTVPDDRRAAEACLHGQYSLDPVLSG